MNSHKQTKLLQKEKALDETDRTDRQTINHTYINKQTNKPKKAMQTYCEQVKSADAFI